MKILMFFLVALPLIAIAKVEDIKCYVILEGDEYVILRQSATANNKNNLDKTFKSKGYYINGEIKLVKEIIECVPVNVNFSLAAANEKELNQPR